MKTILRFCVAGCLILTSLEYADAQSAARSSKEVNIQENIDTVLPVTTDTMVLNYRFTRGIPTPPYIEEMLRQGNISQALTEFEKFKAAQKKGKADPFHLLFCEMTVYQQAQISDPINSEKYKQKIEDLRQEIINSYPNVSDTYILQIDINTPDEKIIELTTKAIELDPENTNAYDTRGRALFKLGKTKEACADFEKLPWKGNMPEYWPCKDLK